MHLNIRSFHKNSDNLLILLDDLAQSGIGVHLIFLCETFLTPVTTPLAELTGYISYHKTRHNRIGGGVSLFIKDDITVNKLYDTPFNGEIESIFANITYEKLSVDCGELYRIPNTPPEKYKEALIEINETLCCDNVIIGTDQNINYMQLDHFKPANELFEYVLSQKLLPCITKPTRVTYESATLIDNIYVKTKKFTQISSCIIIDDMSDHYPCYVSLKLSDIRDNELLTHKSRNYGENSLFNIKHTLLHHDWSCLDSMNVNESYNYLINVITNALDLHAPVREKKVSNRSSFVEPWMNVKILKYNRKSKKLCKKARDTKSNVDIERYKNYRRSLNVLKRQEKRSFYKKLFEKIGNNSKTVWSILNSLSKKVRNRTKITGLLHNNKFVTDKSCIANCFNEHFSNIGKSTIKTIKRSTRDPLETVKECKNYLSDISITETEVEKIVKNMKAKTSCGIDGISNKLLKDIFVTIRSPLTEVISKSVTEGVFPDAMKIAKINPLFKSGNNEICDNYRPISLLPVMSKVLEKIIYKRTVFHLNSNELIYCKQFGFRKNHSTSDAISLLVSEILQSWNSGLSVIGVFIDLRKAFDTVCHDLILKKLEKLGVKGVVLSWFSSYLENRLQYTKINNELSEMCEITVGVPQGSLLGVLLFQLIIDDLRKSIKYGSVILYADDTTIIVAGNNLKFLQKKLQYDLNNLTLWLGANNLALNVKKTKAMLFRKELHSSNLYLTVDNEPIEFVEEFKFLGVIIDSKISFIPHFNYLRGKLQRGLYLLSKLKDLLSTKELRLLYYAHFHSHLTYSISVWGSMISKGNIEILHKLQKQSLRIICKKPFRSHSNPLFKSLNILKVDDQLLLSQSKLMYKVVNCLSPSPLIKQFKTGKCIPTRNKNLIIEKNVCKEYNNSFLVKGIIVWNRLPIHLKNSLSLYTFCKNVKKSFICKYLLSYKQTNALTVFWLNVYWTKCIYVIFNLKTLNCLNFGY